MNGERQEHPFEAAITDYVNDRLGDAKRREFEAAMASDNELADIVAFERQIKAVVAAEPDAVSAAPRFASLEDKLGKQPLVPRTAWGNWLLPAAAALVLMIAVGISYQTTVPDDDFRTLTDIDVAYDTSVVRIVGFERWTPSQQQAFAAEFGLDIVASYASANTLDAIPLEPAKIEELIRQLDADARVRIVRVIEKDQ